MLKAHTASLDLLGFGVGGFARNNPLPGARAWSIARNLTYRPEKVGVPCLLISGWWDNFPRDVVAQFNDLVSRGAGGAKESRLVMGPWSHTAVDAAEQGDLEYRRAEGFSTAVTLKFFDYHLRGIGESGWKEVARVNAFQCGENRWIGGASWEEIEGRCRTFYLRADGGISRQTPEAAEKGDPMTRSYRYDPKDPSPTLGGRNLPPLTHGPKDIGRIAQRRDVLVYATDRLAEPLAILGEAELTVRFRCNRADTDLHVRLCDESPEGGIFLVGETIRRASLRDGRGVQKLQPGETCTLALRLDPHAYTWLKGHRLKLILTGGNSPRYEPNTGTGAVHFEESQALDVEVTILHDAGYPAELKLPVK
jgi:putative CocE/NonD family hydrolase